MTRVERRVLYTAGKVGRITTWWCVGCGRDYKVKLPSTPDARESARVYDRYGACSTRAERAREKRAAGRSPATPATDP